MKNSLVLRHFIQVQNLIHKKYKKFLLKKINSSQKTSPIYKIKLQFWPVCLRLILAGFCHISQKKIYPNIIQKLIAPSIFVNFSYLWQIVYFHVSYQIWLAIKSFATLWTLEIFLACMCIHVLSQIGFEAKFFTAHIAFVWTFARMNSQMSLEETLRLAFFIA